MNTDRALISALRERIDMKQAVRFIRIQDDKTNDKDVIPLILRYEAVHDTKGVLSINTMVDILNNDLFEIYTCNDKPVTYCDKLQPAGAVTGWDIKWVLAPNREAIKQYPFFDCIITKNDNSTGRATDAELFIP